jgi:hypothetical protein
VTICDCHCGSDYPHHLANHLVHFTFFKQAKLRVSVDMNVRHILVPSGIANFIVLKVQNITLEKKTSQLKVVIIIIIILASCMI